MANFEAKQAEYLRRLRFMDDEYMSICFDGDTECVGLILRIILGKDDLEVERVTTQKSEKNLIYKSVIFDVLATDSTGKRYNIEIQRADQGAGFKRARYHSSILDCSLLDKGCDAEQLPDVYVIFITEHDVIGHGKAIYQIEKGIRTDDQWISVEDGSHTLYVNGSIREDTPIGRLMHDFRCPEPDKMYYDVLANRARYFKENPKGERSMSKLWEEIRADIREDAINEGKAEAAMRMLKKGKYSLEEISDIQELPIERVRELQKEIAG